MSSLYQAKTKTLSDVYGFFSALKIQTVSSKLLDIYHTPSKTAVAMDMLAREEGCVELLKLDCDRNKMTRYNNGSCNNLDAPYQVNITKFLL